MISRIAWLALWVTVTLWLGNFWGCASAPVERPGAAPVLASNSDINDAVDRDKPAMPKLPKPKPVKYLDRQFGVSLSVGLSRAKWAPIAYDPPRGQVMHLPHYWEDPQKTEDEIAMLYHPDHSVRAAAAMDLAVYDCCDINRFGHAACNYGNFVFDTVAAPVRFFTEPGWQWQTSPKAEKAEADDMDGGEDEAVPDAEGGEME